MPRVILDRKKYMLNAFKEWMIGRMRTMGITQKDAGQMIGISQPQFHQKLKKSQFDTLEIMTLFKELRASDEEILRLMKM